MKDSEFQTILEGLHSNELKTLRLQEPLTQQQILSLIITLGTNISLVSLDLSGMKLDYSTLVAIGSILVTNTSIEELNLSNTDIDKTSAIYLANILKKNSSLRKLHLGGNNFQEILPIVEAVKDRICLFFSKIKTLLEYPDELKSYTTPYPLYDIFPNEENFNSMCVGFSVEQFNRIKSVGLINLHVAFRYVSELYKLGFTREQITQIACAGTLHELVKSYAGLSEQGLTKEDIVTHFALFQPATLKDQCLAHIKNNLGLFAIKLKKLPIPNELKEEVLIRPKRKLTEYPKPVSETEPYSYYPLDFRVWNDLVSHFTDEQLDRMQNVGLINLHVAFHYFNKLKSLGFNHEKITQLACAGTLHELADNYQRLSQEGLTNDEIAEQFLQNEESRPQKRQKLE